MATQQMPLFESNAVARATVRITKAGDGLSEALSIAPTAIQLGEQMHYVLSGTCTQVNHTEKDDVITRVHTITASAITEIDPDLAEQLLQASAEKVRRAKAEADGQLALDDELAAVEREKADTTVVDINAPTFTPPTRTRKARTPKAAE